MRNNRCYRIYIFFHLCYKIIFLVFGSIDQLKFFLIAIISIFSPFFISTVNVLPSNDEYLISCIRNNIFHNFQLHIIPIKIVWLEKLRVPSSRINNHPNVKLFEERSPPRTKRPMIGEGFKRVEFLRSLPPLSRLTLIDLRVTPSLHLARLD